MHKLPSSLEGRGVYWRGGEGGGFIGVK